MERKTFFIWVAFIIVFLIAIRIFSSPTNEVLLGIDVGIDTTDEHLEFILSTLDQYDAKATFFVPGIYALNNTQMIQQIAQDHEIACRTMTMPRMAQLNQSAIKTELERCRDVLHNITQKDIVGFRAPGNIIDEQTFAVLEELGYWYDASIYENYGWFYPQPTIKEIPVSSFVLLPLSDRWLARRLLMGDLAYFLIKRDRDDVVSISIDPKIVHQHRGAFQYLLYEYADEKAQFKTHMESLDD